MKILKFVMTDAHNEPYEQLLKDGAMETMK